MLYACDGQWWEVYYRDVKQSFKGECWTQDKAAALKYDLYWIEGDQHAAGFSLDPKRIHCGRNSGYQAINLAILMGAKRIILLGFDMGHSGRRHWFGDHPDRLRNVDAYTEFLAAFDTVRNQDLPCEIINCTPGSRLKVFPQAELEAVF